MKPHPTPPATTRREFLRGAARALASGGLGAAVAVLGARRWRQGCIRDSRCGGCPREGGCQLPAAAAYRAGAAPTQGG